MVLSNATGENGLQISADGMEFALVNSVEVARYAESISATALPTTLPPGATIQLNVMVQNKGAMTWSATGSAAVTLGYQWLDANGNAISATVAGVSSVGMLPADVATGQSIAVPITLHTPVLAGSYKLVYDLQQQGTWFAAQGANPLTLGVSIIAIGHRGDGPINRPLRSLARMICNARWACFVESIERE